MKLIKELLNILEEGVFDKPVILKVASQLACAGMDTSPSSIVKIVPTDIRDVTKYLKEIRKPLKELSPMHFEPIVHRVISTLYWYRYHPAHRTIEQIEKVSGLDYPEFLEIFHKHLPEIQQIINVGASALPKVKTSWSQLKDKKKEITDAFSALTKNGQKTSSVNVAKYLVSRLGLSDNLDTLKRYIDKMLETMPELEKHRAVGARPRGKEDDYGGGVKTW